VLIRTLPLWRGNYGGILQAVALQETVRRLGHDVDTDVSERLGLARAARRQVSRLLTAILRRPVGYMARAIKANEFPHRFVAKHLSTVALFRWDFWLKERLLDEYDVLLVGSDQVWRPEYGDVASYLFDFSARSKREQMLISYAASFGTDQPHLTTVEGELAQRFDAISVREESGVRFVESRWKLPAVRHTDPTLLLERADYDAMLYDGEDGRPLGESEGNGIFAYVLDAAEGKNRLLAECADSLGVGLDMFTADPSRFGQAGAPEASPSVESWLRSIRNAEYVITDSFHGCVFSILFNRPFIALGNEARGMARFNSLLRLYGLSDRLMTSPIDTIDTADVVAVLRTPIDWLSVNGVLDADRRAGLDFLRSSLGMAESRRSLGDRGAAIDPLDTEVPA
jgi:hypothetical protein